MPPRQIGFLLLGGIHHILHLIPVAAKLETRPNFTAVIFVRTSAEAAYCERILTELGSPNHKVHIIPASWLSPISEKIGALLAVSKQLKSMSALVVAERTSTLLKRLSNMPPMIHIPHGAGDRAQSYDKRIKHFDHVIVAGPKDKRRMMECGLVSDQNCSVSGYIKAAALAKIYPQREPLFANQRPTILYNPHFDNTLSSWTKFGMSILEQFANQSDYNLIFAPHMRLFAKVDTVQRQNFKRFEKLPHFHVDLGSEKSTDMTYTTGADVYLGDVSSQVYEFLINPGACLFLSPQKFDWQANPDYAHWHYGDVAGSSDNIIEAIGRAQGNHKDYLPIQIKGRDDALGPPSAKALDNAAKQIQIFLDSTP